MQRMQGAITNELLFAVSYNGLGMIQSPHLIANANKLLYFRFKSDLFSVSYCNCLPTLQFLVCRASPVLKNSEAVYPACRKRRLLDT